MRIHPIAVQTHAKVRRSSPERSIAAEKLSDKHQIVIQVGTGISMTSVNKSRHCSVRYFAMSKFPGRLSLAMRSKGGNCALGAMNSVR